MTRPLPLSRRLRDDTSGVAMLEFAFALPIVLALGLYGVENANLALLNLKVSQIALNLADNASRVGTANNLSQQQLREIDINDVFRATELQGAGIKLTENARITLSSLENVQQSYDSAPVQRIHWQRCFGDMRGAGYGSSYGTTTNADGTDAFEANDGTPAPSGMGDAGAMVTAPPNSGVMFVEVNYRYTPITGTWLLGTSRLHYIASFIVRDRRVFTQIYNPSPAVSTSDKQTCN